MEAEDRRDMQTDCIEHMKLDELKFKRFPQKITLTCSSVSSITLGECQMFKNAREIKLV